jgi:mannose-1-phosphate guanylyltransferase
MTATDPVRPWVLILAGGSGTRFWPASRRDRPKHLLPLLAGDRTLLRATIERLEPLTDTERILVVTSADQAQQVQMDVEGVLPPENLVVEPVARNTAPAIALAMVHLGLRGVGPHDPVVVLPSDHWIEDLDGFIAGLRRAVEAARQHKAIVTLGVTPTGPATAYGYLGLGSALETDGDAALPVRHVLQFREKPSPATAQEYFDSGNYLWNAGMFVFRLGYLWYVLGDLREDLDVAMQVFSACIQQDDQAALLDEYAKLEPISIDHAVMEEAPSVLTVPVDVGWGDLGSWDSVGPLLEEGPAGAQRVDELVSWDADGNVVFAPGRTVALVGVRDLVVVATDDAVLVMPKDRAQEVRAVVDELKQRGKDELL